MPDHRGYLLPRERQILLQRLAPVLILFPEAAEQAPYPDDGDAIYTVRGSYHPRAVDLFLKHAKVRYRQSVVVQSPRLLINPKACEEELADSVQAITDQDVDRVLQETQHDPRYAGLENSDLRAAVRNQLVQQHLARRIRRFDQPLSHGRNIDQWIQYFQFLTEDEPDTTRAIIYGRLVQGRAPLEDAPVKTQTLLKQGPSYGPHDVKRTRIALQYWVQYYYDDWANRHEGDWEGITILLELSERVIKQRRELGEIELLDDITVQEAGYSVHEDGYRRLWRDVQKTADGRPIVYVARGSSASYFSWRLEGYPASARVGAVERVLSLPGKLVRGQRILGRRWDAQYSARFTGRDPKNTDWVAADPNPRDRYDEYLQNLLERKVPVGCCGVRREPDFGPTAGYSDATYHLEANDLFWLEMVQEYGVQWGENSLLPGSKGPGGTSRTERDRERIDIYHLALLETTIEQSLEELSGIQISAAAIPELNPALRRLRPHSLRKARCFPKRIQPYVYAMWARVLKEHPEAWPGGPGLRLSIHFRRILYPGLLGFIRKKPAPEPRLERDDPVYHLKALLAQVRRIRYEIQHQGAKWDNPFAWVRYICQPDLFYYGRTQGPVMEQADLLRYLDCGAEMSTE